DADAGEGECGAGADGEIAGLAGEILDRRDRAERGVVLVEAAPGEAASPLLGDRRLRVRRVEPVARLPPSPPRLARLRRGTDVLIETEDLVLPLEQVERVGGGERGNGGHGGHNAGSARSDSRACAARRSRWPDRPA